MDEITHEHDLRRHSGSHAGNGHDTCGARPRGEPLGLVDAVTERPFAVHVLCGPERSRHQFAMKRNIDADNDDIDVTGGEEFGLLSKARPIPSAVAALPALAIDVLATPTTSYISGMERSAGRWVIAGQLLPGCRPTKWTESDYHRSVTPVFFNVSARCLAFASCLVPPLGATCSESVGPQHRSLG